MKSHVFGLVLLSATTLAGAPAHAQNGTLTRSFVSSAGLDSNSCTITAPCASFAVAYTKIGANGIMAALDPGKYGPITITGPVTVNGYGWAAITGPANASAITITSSSGNVILTGLRVDGAGNSANGINYTGAGTLHLENTVVRNFTTYGLAFDPSAASQLLIADTIISDNLSGDGIDILPSVMTATVSGTMRRVTIENNSYGMFAEQSNGATINLTIDDSSISNNANFGLANYGPAARIVVRNSTIANNSDGLVGAAGGIWITRSTISDNVNGTTGSVVSYGDNNLINNATQGIFSSMAEYQ
jgi:hypothetical protein